MSNPISDDCSSGLHEYCAPCECECHMPELLSDKIEAFINWLELNTDFGSWDHKVKTEVHRMLIIFMISEKKDK